MKYSQSNQLRMGAEGGLEGDRKALQYHPHDYQTFSTEFILSHPISAILIQMGLGKSVITLTAIKQLIETGEVKKVLVIGPLRVARDTWPEELRKWDHLRNLTFSVAVGSAEERRKALRSEAMIHIINRENIPWLINQSRIPFNWDMVVIDELSSFKNWQAQRFRALMKARPFVKRIVGLTGTPAPNGYMDLFAEYKLLDMGERLGRFIMKYRQSYFLPDRWGNGQVYSWKLRPGAKEASERKIADITVSMKSVDYLKMPECVMNEIPVFMNVPERAQYDTLKEELFLQVLSIPKAQPAEGGQGGDRKAPQISIVDAKNAAVLCGKLAQMANGAIYTDDGETAWIHDRKLDALEDLIESANGNPLMIAYWFQHDIDRIRIRFPQVRVLKTSQDMKDWNTGQIPVAAIHPASAGHGLNLQAGGNQLVWFGLTWSLELYQQTNARLWRQGQKAETVVIHHIISAGTIDEDILLALKAKDRSQESLINAVKAQIAPVKNNLKLIPKAEGGLEGDRKALQGGAA